MQVHAGQAPVPAFVGDEVGDDHVLGRQPVLVEMELRRSPGGVHEGDVGAESTAGRPRSAEQFSRVNTGRVPAVDCDARR